jgi:hypothetical protein
VVSFAALNFELLLGDGLSEFLPSLGSTFAVGPVDAAVRVAEGSSRESRVQDLHQLKAAQLGD